MPATGITIEEMLQIAEIDTEAPKQPDQGDTGSDIAHATWPHLVATRSGIAVPKEDWEEGPR
eukprot:6161922-Karenia_brevis.AAC.1